MNRFINYVCRNQQHFNVPAGYDFLYAVIYYNYMRSNPIRVKHTTIYLTILLLCKSVSYFTTLITTIP